MLPFIGTSIGSILVFLLKKNLNEKINTMFLGLASGVMIAASVWSLIIPSIEKVSWGIFSFIPCLIGFVIGIGLMLLIEKKVKIIDKKNKIEKSNTLLLTSVTIHNIPEGLSVGAVFASALYGNFNMLIAGAFIFTLGIAIQNIPEGSIIAFPLRAGGMKRGKACIYGILSGAVEPVAALITIMLTSFINTLLPYILAFAAGCMFYVVVEDLIPEMHKTKSYLGILGFTLGFLIMMSLDVALG